LDYVVFGIGFGATILVLGLLLRDFGARLRFRKPRDGGDVLSAEELVAKVSWSRFCTALGSVLALAGATFLLITAVSMVLVVSDDTGLWVMGASFGLLLLLMLYWTWAYFHRFGSYGILPERVEKPEPTPAPIRQPAPARARVYAGPPAPAAPAEANSDDETEVPVAAGAAAETATTGNEAASDAETTPEPAEAAGERETPPAETEAETEPRLETPEERLASVESPIDHGSAEGELDLAVSRPRRPSLRATARPATPGEDAAAEPRTYAGPPLPADLEAER
jgi:hypothetical protein